MTETETLRGAALLQRGAEDLVAFAGGPCGTGQDTECSLGTRFQIASITKQFTAAAVLLLADRGLLSVDDPASRWLDDCPAAWEKITLHHLLSHSAGVPHWDQLNGIDVTVPLATAQKLRVFTSAPLLSQPGERFSYSSPGYVVLAHIVERAGGQRYGAFVAQEIFGPLGMTATFDGNPRGQAGLATGRQDGAVVASFDLDTVGMGTGSIWSTVGDLARWDRALAAGELLSEASRRAMFTVQVPVEDDDGVVRTEGYGYGWFVGSVSGRPAYYHPGDNFGYRTINGWFPGDDVRVAVLSNESSTILDPIVHELVRIAFPS